MYEIEKLKKKRQIVMIIGIVLIIIMLWLIFDFTILNKNTLKLIGRVATSTSGKLVIWDNTIDDIGLGGDYKLTYCSSHCDEKGKSSVTWDVTFYADYTDAAPVGCSISFKLQGESDFGSEISMTASGGGNYDYTTYFTEKGNHEFRVTCTGDIGEEAIDSFIISNTPPWIDKGPTGNLPLITCGEDDSCGVSISSYVEDDDTNDNLNYYVIVENTTLTSDEFTLSSSGSLNIHVTEHETTGKSQKVEFYVEDTDNAKEWAFVPVYINAIDDVPVLEPIGNLTAGVGKSFSYQVLASDSNLAGEDTTDDIVYNLETLVGDLIFTINSFTGEITNVIGLTENHVKNYTINVSVSDILGNYSYEVFLITVYNNPWFIDIYLEDPIIANESEEMNITVLANHTIGDNLTYSLYLNDEAIELKDSEIGAGNGTGNYTFRFDLGPDVETTCTGLKNLTINISNPEFSNFSIWNISINHTNYPISFFDDIPYIEGGDSVKVPLFNYGAGFYFYDVDVFDTCHNQSIELEFKRLNSSLGEVGEGNISIEFNLTDNSVTFSTDRNSYEYFRIIANDSEYEIESNNFSVNLSVSVVEVPVEVPTPTPTSGGGAVIPVLLKLVMPGPVSIFQLDRIELPIKLINDGKRRLYDITLSAIVLKDGRERDDIKVDLSLYKLDSLNIKEEENLTLTIISEAKEIGTYEVLINASVRNPKYRDWGKIYLQINKTTEKGVERLIVFTEELLAENPECLELRENLNEADKLLKEGRTSEAFSMTNEVIDSCKYAISYSKSLEKPIDYKKYIYYISIILGIILIIGFAIYYFYRKVKFKKTKSFYKE